MPAPLRNASGHRLRQALPPRKPRPLRRARAPGYPEDSERGRAMKKFSYVIFALIAALALLLIFDTLR